MGTMHRSLALATVGLVAATAGAASQAQLSPRVATDTRSALPFAIGEHLVYAAHAGPGLNGTAEMWIEGPEMVRGTSTMVLRFTFATKVGFLRVADNTTSWLDPLRMATMRFQKDERHLLARHSEDVSMEPLARHWTSTDGREGTSPSDIPLDELSFIYAIRTFPLADGATLTLDRHFDTDRSPTTIRSLGRGAVTTPAGTFATREIEMKVRDVRNYQGEGTIRFSLSDDACRRPVRIESRIPGAGTVVLTLRSAVPQLDACAGRAETAAP